MTRRILIALLLIAAGLSAPAPAAAGPALVAVLAPGDAMNVDGTPFKPSPQFGVARAWGCTVNYMCFYDLANGDTNGAAYPIHWTWTGCRGLPSWMNDKTSSIRNNTSYTWYVYEHYYGPDACGQLGMGSTVHPQSQGNMNSTWNNIISSYQRG